MSGDASVRTRRRFSARTAVVAVVGVLACTAVVGSRLAGVDGARPVPTVAHRPVLDAVQSVAAVRASSLLGMVGVNIHSDAGSTPYGDYPATLKLLEQLGVREVRDDMAYNPQFVRSDQYTFYNELEAAGIKVDLVLSPGPSQADMAGRLASVAKYFPTAVNAIEGPNELNVSPGDTQWAAQDQSYTKALSAAVAANPTLRSIPVLAPPLADYLAISNGDTGFKALGNLTDWISDGNVHLYPGGRDPTWNMDATLSGVQFVSGTDPVWVTEAGYHDAVTTPGRDAWAPDSVIADYLPRLLLEWATRHVGHVNLYELYDEAADPGDTNFHDHFGLVSLTGRPKAQFDAVRNFDHLLVDNGASFTPGSLGVSVSSGLDPVSTYLVEKSNGEFVLFLWRDVAIWNPLTSTTIPEPAVPVTVTLAAPASKVTEYRPSLSPKVQLTATDTSTVTVGVGGDVVALDIKP